MMRGRAVTVKFSAWYRPAAIFREYDDVREHRPASGPCLHTGKLR
jgi:hypothetical protein